MSRETRAMQDDDATNPAASGCSTAKRCGAARRGRPASRAPATATRSMKGVAARYPAVDVRAAGRTSSSGSTSAASSGRRRRRCAYESRELLALTAYVGAPVARHADRHRVGTKHEAIPRGGARGVQSPAGTAQPLLRAVPRRQLGQAARRQRHPAGASDRLSALPAGMAGAWARCSGGCATA